VKAREKKERRAASRLRGLAQTGRLKGQGTRGNRGGKTAGGPARRPPSRAFLKQKERNTSRKAATGNVVGKTT